MKRTLAILLVVLCGLAAFAQMAAPPSESDLAAITQKGILLAEYDQAAWHATDAVQALKPPQGETTGYIARKVGDEWTVVFGRLNESGDKYLVVYEVKGSLTPKTLTVKKVDPPREEAGFFLSAAKAIQTVLKDFQRENRPYNVAVLPANPLQLYVYIMPAQTQSDVYPLGGDARYLIGDEGGTIVVKRQLHKTILEMPAVPSGAQANLGFHTHVITDLPEDTDVFHVLSRRGQMPEIITTHSYAYQVQTDGSITCLGKTDKFLQLMKKLDGKEKSKKN